MSFEDYLETFKSYLSEKKITVTNARKFINYHKFDGRDGNLNREEILNIIDRYLHGEIECEKEIVEDINQYIVTEKYKRTKLEFKISEEEYKDYINILTAEDKDEELVKNTVVEKLKNKTSKHHYNDVINNIIKWAEKGYLVAYYTNTSKPILLKCCNLHNYTITFSNLNDRLNKGLELCKVCEEKTKPKKVNESMSKALKIIKNWKQGEILDLSGLKLKELPELPETVTGLNCSKNLLTRIKIPKHVDYVICNNNKLESIEVHNDLSYLDCSFNNIKEFKTLPEKLIMLYCSKNQLTSLPSPVDNLEKLDCSYNKLKSLPELNDSLEMLDCSFNEIEELPPLPHLLVSLFCRGNKLSNLPELPEGLIDLNCSDNNLTELPELNPYLDWLVCSNNNLVNIKDIDLTYFDCSNNVIKSISSLQNVEVLNISYNNLLSLPTLPECLKTLVWGNNIFKKPPVVPKNCVCLKKV